MQKSLLADALLLFITFIWGTTFVLVQQAIDYLPPFTFLGMRFMLAFVIMLPFLALPSNRPGDTMHVTANAPGHVKRHIHPLVAAFIIGVSLFLGYALQTFGLLYTTASKAGFITGLSVVLVPALSYFILGTRLKFSTVIGVVLALLGLYALTLGDAFVLNIGDILVFMGAIAFALQIVTTSKYAPLYNPVLLAIGQIGVVALLSLIFAFLFEPVYEATRISLRHWQSVGLALFVTAVLATSLAYWAQTTVQKYTSPVHVALIFSMEPVFAALTAWVVNDERFTPLMWLGSSLILVGMLLSELPVFQLSARVTNALRLSRISRNNDKNHSNH
ncbi:MAG: Permease of the drug/metabolite transporter (DMT) superfamily [Candidatus Carbobacillus altaicus]|uniref:Permease of the drug/metabolite transporter (DMT) superfamily n=1 Tax=Candidatus Carbonibacillus altaicus TaxID=2163959 RepID=A0A2R6XXM4_9BACL|nr:MAG: Permease of the drug/metabolite transporter (DMT) superfamily [Candidatus Carbobacillus altaicus]